jgi:hypothetical protein
MAASGGQLAAMIFPRGKDLVSAILFWVCAVLVWGGLAAVAVWFIAARFR